MATAWSELRKAVQYEKNIILCHVEGANVGAMLKDKPPEVAWQRGVHPARHLRPRLPQGRDRQDHGQDCGRRHRAAAPKPAETAVSAKCAGSFSGDKVASKIDYEPQDLHKGDIGLVLACPNMKLDDQAKRIRIQFGGKGLVDLVAEGSTAQCEPAPKLAGGASATRSRRRLISTARTSRLATLASSPGRARIRTSPTRPARSGRVWTGDRPIRPRRGEINPAENLATAGALAISRIDYDATSTTLGRGNDKRISNEMSYCMYLSPPV